MIDFKNLLETCQAEAIANKMSPTEDSVFRSICRSYSKLFHTPLHVVEDLDPEYVILRVYEEQIADTDTEDYQKLEHILDTLRSIEDPDYDRKKAEELAEFDKQAELEEEARIKSGRAVHPSLQKDLNEKILLEKGEPIPPAKPTGGSIDLSYLSKTDSEG